jgi:Carboxypeptidase regulatory-like domain
MNSSSRMIRTAAVLALSLVLTSVTSAEPQSKRRAVKPGSGTSGVTPAQPTALLTGTILDSTTNAPVVGVLVQISSRSGRTDAHGNFLMKMVPGEAYALTFSRTGYDPLSTTVTITADAAQTFRMIPRGTVKVRMTSGVTSELDPETVEFGYVAPFAGYNEDTTINLCKSGGESFKPDRADIKHITAGVPLSDTKCCPDGPIPSINVELKSGGTTNAGFADACFGYKVDIIAIDHVTAGPVYYHFSDIAELTFP